jgi:hypothetical protein
MSELTVLDPAVETLTLSDGTEVKLLDLKARQFFKALRILTHGPAMNLITNPSTLQGEPEAILGRVVGFLLVSIPDAYDETLAFLHDMVQPVGLVDGKAAAKSNAEKWDKLRAVMANPELEDVVDLVDAIVKRESADLAALGKKVASLFKLAKKTGQLEPDTSPTSLEQNTSEDSAEPSTSSVPSTDGQTSE